MQRKCYSWTLNNYTSEDIERIRQHEHLFDYAIWGREIAPETGTPHLQGYFKFKTKQRFNTVRAILGGRGHLEGSKGSPKQNHDYCAKSGDYETVGDLVVASQSSLELVCQMLKDGVRLAQIAADYPSIFVRHHRGLRELSLILGVVKPRDFKTGKWAAARSIPESLSRFRANLLLKVRWMILSLLVLVSEVLVFYGASGTGKSRRAAELCGSESTYYKPRGKWWDGYANQDNVIIDDFYGWLSFDEFLRIADRYPCRVEVKGGFAEFTSKRIIITSNQAPSQWWRGEWFKGEQLKALTRRLDVVCFYSAHSGLPHEINCQGDCDKE
uniref:Replication-associated protein n=1 Tax=Duck associated cyclovirus 1 TaxID=2006585 RepID=A0A346BLG1_9CIRC|nr:replication associated protein [Duck associated cyclovirus 1]AXL64566.1 replication associated protein [Duck associated cyclovirus 1]